MGIFSLSVNDFQPLINVSNNSCLDVAGIRDTYLGFHGNDSRKYKNQLQNVDTTETFQILNFYLCPAERLNCKS